MSAPVFLAVCEDCFKGYGVYAVGATEDDALAALVSEYKATRRRRGGEDFPNLRTSDEIRDYYGIRVRALQPGDRGAWLD